MSDMTELARRAVACHGWRWMPGMLAKRPGLCDIRLTDGGADWAIGYGLGATRDGGGHFDGPADGLSPDFTDAATVGCLEALVCEAWDRPAAGVVQRTSTGGDIYWIFALPAPPRPWPPLTGDTKAEALVAALEAAQ